MQQGIRAVLDRGNVYFKSISKCTGGASKRSKYVNRISDRNGISNTMTCRYDHLRQLFNGYFHQDWDIEGETDADVVAAFLRTESLDQKRLSILELDKLIQNCSLGKQDAQSALEKLGCEYYYQADGLNGIGWLTRLRMLLRS